MCFTIMQSTNDFLMILCGTNVSRNYTVVSQIILICNHINLGHRGAMAKHLRIINFHFAPSILHFIFWFSLEFT